MRFDAVVFVPSAPMLMLGTAPTDLCATIDEALDVLVGDVVVVGAAPRQGWWEGTVDLTPWGFPGTPADDPLPLSLAVGRTLLGDRPHRLWGAPGQPPEGDSILVVADGSAKRTEKAPGGYDPRADQFDADISGAIRAGDPRLLESLLDEELAHELWVGGLTAWQAVGELRKKRVARVLYDDAPFGVGYVVATWTARRPD